MPNEALKKEDPVIWERHAQTVLAMILVALLLWVGSTVQTTSIAVAEMRVEISYLKGAVDDPHEEILLLHKRVNALEDSIQ